MRIGVPREGDQEPRVAATPDTVKRFVGLGATVVVASGAGERSRIPDAAFAAAGAEIAASSADALRGMTSIRIKRHDNGADHAAQVAVLLNGKEVKSEPVTNSRWMQVIPQELGQLQDRNVLEIAIKDDKFNKGAIWGELNRNRILEVEFK